MLPSYFDCIFVHLKQKVRLRPELSPKFLSTLGPNPTRKALPDLQLWYGDARIDPRRDSLLEIGLLKKWELLGVIMTCPKPCSTISLILKNRFDQFDSNYWHLCVSQFRDIRKKWLCKISGRISNIAFLILQEVFQSILFWCDEISKRMFANGTESNALNLFCG